MNRLTLVHAFSDEIEITKEPSPYAAKGYAYLVPDKANFIEIAKDRSAIEKDRNEWIRKYQNVLDGLAYWKNRALER